MPEPIAFVFHKIAIKVTSPHQGDNDK